MTEHIISNQAQCTKCGDIIFSAHVHDYVECTCKAISIDGGNSYLRHGCDVPSSFLDMSLSMDKDDFHKVLAYTKEMYKSRNELGILYGVFRVLRDEGYKVVKDG